MISKTMLAIPFAMMVLVNCAGSDNHANTPADTSQTETTSGTSVTSPSVTGIAGSTDPNGPGNTTNPANPTNPNSPSMTNNGPTAKDPQGVVLGNGTGATPGVVDASGTSGSAMGNSQASSTLPQPPTTTTSSTTTTKSTKKATVKTQAPTTP